MKNTMKRIATIIMAVVIVLTAVSPMTVQAAGKKVKLNKTKVALTITAKKQAPTATLKVKNTTKKVKWSVSDKKVATVKRVDKTSAKVTAKKAGTVKVTAMVNGRQYTCKVTVVDTRSRNNNSNDSGDTGKTEGPKPLVIRFCNACGYKMYIYHMYYTPEGKAENEAWDEHMDSHGYNEHGIGNASWSSYNYDIIVKYDLTLAVDYKPGDEVVDYLD